MSKKFINLDLTEFNKIRKRFSEEAKKWENFVISAPAGLVSFIGGRNFPDKDISLLDAGAHRYFLFHSAIGLYLLKKFHQKYINEFADKDNFTSKILGASLTGAAVGVGIHLLSDCFSPKAIIFPFFGSLVSDTLVDDRLWLLGNSLWCFKIAKDTYVLTFGRNLTDVKKFVKEIYSSKTVDIIKKFIKKHPVIGGVAVGGILGEILNYLMPDIGLDMLDGIFIGSGFGIGWKLLKEVNNYINYKLSGE